MIEETEGFKTPFFIVEGDGCNDFYKEMQERILERGIDVSPRGMKTLEVHPAMVIILKPQERFLTSPGRLIHPFFQMMESIWILGGRSDVEFMGFYLKNIEKYSDNRDIFHAPYGQRMRRWNTHRDEEFPKGVRDQFADCYRLLRIEPNTRQSIMVYWNPSYDHPWKKTIDRPCNTTFQFLIRDHKIDFTIYNRSNDLNYGFSNANIVQFSVILETMSMLLKIPVGKQIHMINSLHLYMNEENEKITERVLNAKYEFNAYFHVKPNPFKMEFKTGDRVADIDQELRIFFEAEKEIREGNLVDNNLSFNYLRDGLVLAKSFYFYKKNEFLKAADVLNELEADDIFVSCLEFVSRKCGSANMIERVEERFKNRITSVSLKAISQFVINH